MAKAMAIALAMEMAMALAMALAVAMAMAISLALAMALALAMEMEMALTLATAMVKAMAKAGAVAEALAGALVRIDLVKIQALEKAMEDKVMSNFIIEQLNQELKQKEDAVEKGQELLPFINEKVMIRINRKKMRLGIVKNIDSQFLYLSPIIGWEEVIGWEEDGLTLAIELDTILGISTLPNFYTTDRLSTSEQVK